MKYSILTGALLSATLMTPAFATDITVEDFVGKITIIDGNDGVEVVRNGKQSADYRENGDTIIIDGGLSRKQRDKACKGGGLSWDLDFNGRESKGNTKLQDYPEIRISVPRGSDLTIRDSFVRLDSQLALGVADLHLSGCFDANLADADEIILEKSGSGEITIGTVGSLKIEKSGAGDLEIEKADRFSLDQSGSGEVEIDRVDGPVEIEKSGSGDIEIGYIDGILRIDKSGSGDVEVDGGTIPELSVHISGSGDVQVHAAVGDAYIRASGSSDIYVKSISGSVDSSVSGSADFNRGDD
ncbi:hypothetical protein GCM10007853_22800 [Algimonas ampicilliniresistens]|uniref:Putative auto-transporter adhesin head GIN domain-containing protein n=1 Tax=Algimonas ampicilliniresistens TaxID=1298735 RepID=A0ABQ5VA45_9PROT|nr:DUF2807 domain-containing protein [Algimonas ampicilliniresistens]GLQ24406.1 hypothetical protein GCM10007853_22800 [Algimonas ampicilliniresistens]